MTVQAGLCQTCSETTLLVFPRGGSYILFRDVNECQNWYSNIRIGYSNIFEYSNDIHIYTQLAHYDDLLGGTCIENMRYMYMHGIVSGLYQCRHVRKSTNFAQKTRQSGGV